MPAPETPTDFCARVAEGERDPTYAELIIDMLPHVTTPQDISQIDEALAEAKKRVGFYEETAPF